MRAVRPAAKPFIYLFNFSCPPCGRPPSEVLFFVLFRFVFRLFCSDLSICVAHICIRTCVCTCTLLFASLVASPNYVRAVRPAANRN